MDNKPYKNFIVSRPKDKSLEAYKTWMIGIAKRPTTEKTGIKWSEEEWKANWKKYWQERPDG